MKFPLPKAALWLVLLAIVLASCSPKAAAPTLVPTAIATSPEAIVPTTTSSSELSPAVCKVSSSAIPAASAEELAAVASVPPVGETDLVRGPANAAVTIIEYSDYQ